MQRNVFNQQYCEFSDGNQFCQTFYTGEKWGGGGNLGVFLVQVCEPFFLENPNHIDLLGLQKNDLFIYLIEQNVYIFIYSQAYTIL